MKIPYYTTCSQCGRVQAVKFFRIERRPYFLCHACVNLRTISAIIHRGTYDNDRSITVYDHTHRIPSQYMYAVAMRWVVVYRNTFAYVGAFDKRSRVPMKARTTMGTIQGTIERTSEELVINFHALEDNDYANQARKSIKVSA